MVKMQVFYLLAALCVYSEAGYALAVDALNHYKVQINMLFCFVRHYEVVFLFRNAKGSCIVLAW